MSRETVMSETFERYELARCDKCDARWTLAVCKKQGWLLSDEKDLCERCRPQKRKTK
jgi:hypothetical protein